MLEGTPGHAWLPEPEPARPLCLLDCLGQKRLISLGGPSEWPSGGCGLRLCVRTPACAWVRGLVRVAAASG